MEMKSLSHLSPLPAGEVKSGLLRGQGGKRIAVLFLVIAIGIALPFLITGDYARNLLVLTLIFGMAAVGLNIIMGMMGQFSFGHAAIWGIGAYVSGRFAYDLGINPWASLVLGALAAGAIGALVAAVALRRNRGLELAIVTLGFGAIAWTLSLRWTWFGGGLSGVSGVPDLTLPGLPLDTAFRFYFFALIALVAVVAGVYAFQRSRAGRAVISVRENEPLASSIGVSPYFYFVLAFTVASLIAGLSGGLYAHYVGFLNPSMLSLPIMIMFLMMVLIGGTGHVWGPILGAAIYVWLTDFLTFNQELQLLFFGILVVIAIRFMPEGLASLLVKIRALLVKKRDPNPRRELFLTDSTPSVTSLSTLDTLDTEVTGQGSSAEGVCLAAEHISMRFGGLVAVDDLTFDVASHEILGLIGPNGSGKTTTISMMSGFLTPTSGDVSFLGTRINGRAPHRIARLGLVRTFQLSNVYGRLSVRDNLVHSSHLYVRRGVSKSELNSHVDEILSFVGLSQRADDMAADLSAGERRYLEVGNALAARPVTILLDEPASGLNAEETARLGNLIRSIRNSGLTVVIVEHNVRMIMSLCDRIVVLDQGRLLSSGSPSEVSRDEAVAHAYLGRSGKIHDADN